jgi:hypothetical protein
LTSQFLGIRRDKQARRSMACSRNTWTCVLSGGARLNSRGQAEFHQALGAEPLGGIRRRFGSTLCTVLCIGHRYIS